MAWRRAEPTAELAGRFPSGSGPNCFSTVMGRRRRSRGRERTDHAGAVQRVADQRTTPIQGTRHDHRPGVVLVWRNSAGQPDHAAVTIGGGYAVTKPSQLGAVPGSSGPYRRPSLQVGSAAYDSVAT